MTVETLFKKLIQILAVVILCFLTAMALLFSYRYGIEELGELTYRTPLYQERDNLLFHAVGIAIVLGFFFGAKAIQRRRDRKRVSDMAAVPDHGNGGTAPERETAKRFVFIQFLCSILCALFAYCILISGTRAPGDDQAQVYSAAALFNQGNFINLSIGGYMNMQPHQLGYVAYLQLIFLIAGNYNYHAVQVINCFFIGGLFFFLWQCVNELTGKMSVRVFAMVLSMATLQIYLFVSWVYGDMPSYFFSFIFLWLFLRFHKTLQKKYLLFSLPMICLAVSLRKNALIILIAAAIILLVDAVSRKKWIFLIYALLVIALPLSVLKITEITYETVSGYEIDGGLPSLNWIAIGMSEEMSQPGWFTDFGTRNYYLVDCDSEAASQIYIARIRERIETFLSDPLYAVSFYKRKICTQWNDCFYWTKFMLETDDDTTATGVTAFLINHESELFVYFSVLQAVTYLGALLYCITRLHRAGLYEYVLILTFIGGFFFSILWEANSRYVFIYVLCLLPLAALGWQETADWAERKFLKKNKG